MAFALRCPDCRKTFKWNVSEPDPEECPMCGARMPEDKTDDDNVIVMPMFLSAKTKANDALQRQTVDASEQRMHKAAEMAGCDASDMAGLKITDLRPTVHEGAIAAPPVNNVISQQMDAMAARGMPVGFGAGANGSEFAAGISTGAVTVDGRTTHGIVPRAGANAVQRAHKLIHGH